VSEGRLLKEGRERWVRPLERIEGAVVVESGLSGGMVEREVERASSWMREMSTDGKAFVS
jgi:hypothetical protein